MEAIERLWRRVLALIGRARVTAVDDRGSVQILQVRTSAVNVQDDVPRLAEYGLASHPPIGSDAVTLSIAGGATDTVVIATGHQSSRPTSLAEGEVMLYDTRGQRVYVSAAGIRVVGTNLPIDVTTSGDVTVHAANIRIVGNLTVTGTILANGHVLDETHTHLLPGGGFTGVVS